MMSGLLKQTHSLGSCLTFALCSYCVQPPGGLLQSCLQEGTLQGAHKRLTTPLAADVGDPTIIDQ